MMVWRSPEDGSPLTFQLGTAKAALFALEQLGFDLGRVHLHNRTVERAHAIATVFGCRVLSDLDRDAVPDVDVRTDPAPCARLINQY